MSDPVLVAIIGGAVVLYGAFVERRAKKRDGKLDHIILLTDGNYGAVVERLDRAEDLLRQMVAERAAEGSPVTKAESPEPRGR